MGKTFQKGVHLVAQNGLDSVKGPCGTTIFQCLSLEFSAFQLNFISIKRVGQVEENWQENYK